VNNTTSHLSVTSHVGRDLQQSAALFKHEHLVAWEYVSNGLQYVDPGVAPFVTVTIDQGQRSMKIKDNGKGMNLKDLANYFTMHGENLDALAGQPGRGKFGTGKSAAFGIANKLRLSTVKGGKKSVVELHRSDFAKQTAANKVPIQILESEITTDEPNGTTVEVLEINLKSIDTNTIIREIERHIAHWKNVTVFVGQHKCQYIEPATSYQEEYFSRDTPFVALLGDVSLKLSVAKAPLKKEQQGIAITSNGVLHETTYAGQEKRPFVNYIFGSIDVPTISSDDSPISAFDMSRSGVLNQKNELVRGTMAFIGMSLEKVLQKLEEDDQKRRHNDEVQRLKKEADAIANLINEDFKKWKVQIQNVLAHTVGANDSKPSIVADEEDFNVLAGEGDVASTVTTQEGGPSDIHNSEPHSEPPTPDPDNSAPTFLPDLDGDETSGNRKLDPRKKSRGGGFSVDFRELGDQEHRARYEASERSILVNLEHPQIVAALGVGGVEEAAFRRLAYEVAFAEYAIALSVEMANDSHFIDPQDAITSVRETINRMATLAASLYR